MAKKNTAETPLMRQYNNIKSRYPDAILLFRVGDFYETFGQDAIVTSNVLGIVLTKRANGAASEMELAGFPHHALDTYLPKLVRAGYRVAICDQLEDPKLTKTIVKRGVTELVTPGVNHNDKILDHKSNNFLAAVHFDKKSAGVAFADISTGEFLVAQGSLEYIDKLVQGFQPAEVLYAKPRHKQFIEMFGDKLYTYVLEDWIFTTDYARETLLKHFETSSLKGFGVEELESGIVAAGVILHYLIDTQHPNISHITAVSRIEEDKYVWLDRFTVRNLELIQAPFESGTSLLQVMDKTTSPMGARLLRRWMLLPLKDKLQIEDRLNTVEFFIKDPELTDQLKKSIRQVGDLERLIAKVPLGKVNPRDIVQLKRALSCIEEIKGLFEKTKHEGLNIVAEKLNPCRIIKERIEKEIGEDPPVAIEKGNVIKSGVLKELDELRVIKTSGKDKLIEIQQRESEKTGIPSLKIGFNNVFGYFLEVRNTHKNKVPESWIRKQTLVSAERYITQELKEYEEKILTAEEKILGLEKQLFEQLVTSLFEYIELIQLNCQLVARVDCLLSFVIMALESNYRKPEITEDHALDIKEGRHPVIEKQLPVGEEYVPNNVFLDNEKQQIIIITGPNMAGKSALLRQTALITLMAQMGSFVPAKSAKIGIVDKIFTRVGASDNISSGESTFMVEMNETASIINNISERSLILLDEIGRGTSTYDGISLAWSIVEYLHDNKLAKPKTLFATHYHELNELENTLERVRNFNVSVKEVNNKVIFLRKLKPGGSEHSFGIHVAKMAGMPNRLIIRANEILKSLEEQRSSGDAKGKLKSLPPPQYQLNLFQMDDPIMARIKEELSGIDLDTLTPIDALLKMSELKKELDK